MALALLATSCADTNNDDPPAPPSTQNTDQNNTLPNVAVQSGTDPDGGWTLSKSIRAVFKPFSRAAARIMFWDPFAAVGLYDPILRTDSGEPLLDTHGQIRTVQFPFVVAWLIGIALFFSIRMRFINFRGFVVAIRLLTGRYTDPNSPGEVTQFQALATALSGTVGLGNIAGVALAISIGGPGATFWMMLAGILGMATKFVECTLGVKYRIIDAAGQVSGGPMYYLRDGLARRTVAGFSLAPLGKGLGMIWALFAILGSLAGGNMFQANQSFTLAKDMFPFLDGYGAHFGMALGFCVAIVIIGGIKEIGKVTGKLVPAMAILYVVISVIIIFAHITEIGDVFVMIFRGAFAPDAAQGGFVGVLVIGLRRAAFSNEAGVGTAAIAHSAAKTPDPVAEGVVGLHEPFIDTVIICTMTALVIIFTGYHEAGHGLQAAAMTSAAFGSVFSWFPYVLLVAILLFSFSTMISFAYYGSKCFDYCFGGLFERFLGRRQVATRVFQAIFLLATVVGAASSVRAVMDYSDVIIFGLATTNTIGLLIMSGEVRQDLRAYWQRIQAGEIFQRRNGAPRPK